MKLKKLLQQVLRFGLIFLFLVGCSKSAPSPFTEDVIRSYAALAELQNEVPPDASYITGKAVVINIGETIDLSRFSAREQKHHILANTVSSAQKQIDREIRASTPEEVGTVILLKWSKEALGETAAGTKYRLNCEVMVIDKSASRIVFKSLFMGDKPKFATLYGASPQDFIVKYINSLPRR